MALCSKQKAKDWFQSTKSGLFIYVECTNSRNLKWLVTETYTFDGSLIFHGLQYLNQESCEHGIQVDSFQKSHLECFLHRRYGRRSLYYPVRNLIMNFILRPLSLAGARGENILSNFVISIFYIVCPELSSLSPCKFSKIHKNEIPVHCASFVVVVLWDLWKKHTCLNENVSNSKISSL